MTNCVVLSKSKRKCARGNRFFCGILILLSSLVEEYFCTCPRRRKFTAPSNSVSIRAIRSDIQAVGLYVSSCLCFSLYTFLLFYLECFLVFFWVIFFLFGRLSCLLVTRQSHPLLMDNLGLQTCTSLDSSKQRTNPEGKERKHYLYFKIKQSNICLEIPAFF